MNHVYTGLLAPFLPNITNDLGLTLTEAGIVTSAAIITMTSSHLAVGIFVDRGWKDIFIPASVLVGAIIILFSSIANSFLFLVMCMALLGFGAAPYHPSAFPALAEKFPQSARAKATGIQAAGGLIGMALIPIMGVALLEYFGNWRDSIVTLGILGIVVFIPSAIFMHLSRKDKWMIVEEEKDNNESELDGPDGWTRNFYVALVVSALRGMPFRCTTLLMPLYLFLNYGYEPLWAGSLTTLMLVTGLFGQLVSAPLSDRYGRRKPFIILSTGLMAPFMLLLNFSLDQPYLILVLMGIGFFYFFGVPPNQAFETEVSPSKSRGLAFGILFSIGAIPGALSPVIFGVIGDNWGLNASILFLVIVSLIASFFALFIREDEIPNHHVKTVIH